MKHTAILQVAFNGQCRLTRKWRTQRGLTFSQSVQRRCLCCSATWTDLKQTRVYHATWHTQPISLNHCNCLRLMLIWYDMIWFDDMIRLSLSYHIKIFIYYMYVTCIKGCDEMNSTWSEVVGFASDERTRMGRSEIAFADIYHSANRYSTGTKERLPICLPRSMFWSFDRKRLLLGRESLLIQGHAVSDAADDFLESQLQDLAGNAFLGNYK